GFKGPDQQKPAGVLSGGERNRLNLALTLKQGAGWQPVGKEGTEAECSAYVDEVWTDMRPKSLRERMENAGA
ncbi:hypothetical protein ACWDE9_36535, partial [Streptomyces olivaceoviridis]